MRLSRYLDAREFLDEARKLKAVRGHPSQSTLERLEQQRSLVPLLRLCYPDAVERRWCAESREERDVVGKMERDGPRWDAACALEGLRRKNRGLTNDPATTLHPFDDPETRFRQFLQDPADKPFRPWRRYRLAFRNAAGEMVDGTDTAIPYYSSWQLLQFAEVVNMGVMHHLNLLERGSMPERKEVAQAPRSISFMPIHAMRGITEHRAAFDAIVWFAEEANLGHHYAVREGSGRRLLTEAEREEIMRTRLRAAEFAQRRYGVGPDELLAANRFLCSQWSEWDHEGRPRIADAYKSFAAQGVRLACLASGVETQEYRSILGYVGGYTKPIMNVIWPDWAEESRDDAHRIIVSYRRPDALLGAEFSDDLAARFLAFIEREQLHGFYWRMESFNRHAFKGNGYSLEGLKGDVQGMAVVLEHIATALGGRKEQLRDKFKELWTADPAVLKLLKDNRVMKVGNGKSIDLDWFETRNSLGPAEQTAGDLAISYAIRGGAHRVIEETNPLKLERMMLIMIRAAVKTFDAVTRDET